MAKDMKDDLQQILENRTLETMEQDYSNDNNVADSEVEESDDSVYEENQENLDDNEDQEELDEESESMDEPSDEENEEENHNDNIIKKMMAAKDGEEEDPSQAAKFVQSAQKAVSRLGSFGQFLVALVTNPVFWIVVAAVLIATVILSGTKVIGQSDYNVQCLPSGSANVEVSADADAFTRQSAIATWLTSTPFERFGSQPMSKEQASGVIGNFIQESSGANPTVVETLSLSDPDFYKTCDNECVLSWGSVGGKAVGIAQWDSGRRVGLVNYATSVGKPWYDLNVQLNFLKGELDGPEGDNLVRGGFASPTHTPEDYALMWNRLFERSAGDDNSPHVIKRQAEAKKFFESYKGGGGFVANCTGASIDTSNAVQLAIQISYPMSDRTGRQNCSTIENCGMSFSKPEYITAKALAEEKGGKDSIVGLLASCDRFVATVLKASGTDPDYPWGAVSSQEAYMKDSPNWEQVSCQARQPGDIIVETDAHIMMYLGVVEGKESLASASHMERTASIMPVGCNGDKFNADSYPSAQGWRKVR